jgi:hypothetical protein
MPLGSYRLNGIAKRLIQIIAGRAAKFLEGIGYTRISTTQSRFGGSSFQIAGYPDCIMSVHPDFAFQGDFTAECWFYFSSHDNFGGIMTYANEAGGFAYGWQILFNSNTNNLAFEMEGQSGFFIASNTVTANVWNHVALVRNGSSVVLYVNGVNSASTTSSSQIVQQSYNFVVGLERTLQARTPGFYDEIRLSKVARYTGNFTPPSSAFTKDENTVLLLHADGTNNQKVFADDADEIANIQTIHCFGGSLSTADKKFGVSSFFTNGFKVGAGMASQKLSNLSPQDNWTVEGWFKPVIGQVITLFMFGNEYFNRYTIFVDASGVVKADRYSTGLGNFTASVALTNNTWQHIAFVKNGTTGTLYIDGVSRATTTNIAVDPIGAIGFRDSIFRAGYSYNGYIDEVRFSQVARYTSNFTPASSEFSNDSNTLCLWQCNGDNGATNFTDTATYNPYTRTTKTLTAFGDAKIVTAQSRFGGASAFFDGNDKVWTNSSPNFVLDGDFTIEFWTRATNNTPQYNSIISAFGTTGVFTYPGSWAIRNRFNNINQLAMTIRTNSGWTDITTSFAITASSPSWIHVAAVRSGSTVTLYANGTSRGSATVTHPLGLDWEKLVLGGFGGSQLVAISGEGYYTGWLDEVRISNVARYTSNFTSPSSAFVNDANTVLLVHCNGANNSTTFTDDNT